MLGADLIGFASELGLKSIPLVLDNLLDLFNELVLSLQITVNFGQRGLQRDQIRLCKRSDFLRPHIIGNEDRCRHELVDFLELARGLQNASSVSSEHRVAILSSPLLNLALLIGIGGVNDYGLIIGGSGNWSFRFLFSCFNCCSLALCLFLTISSLFRLLWIRSKMLIRNFAEGHNRSLAHVVLFLKN